MDFVNNNEVNDDYDEPVILYIPFAPNLSVTQLGNDVDASIIVTPTDEEELGALMRLVMHMDWGVEGNPANLKGKYSTWTEAFHHSGLNINIPTNFTKDDFPNFNNNSDVLVINLVSVIKLADSNLWMKYFNNNIWCWHCGKINNNIALYCGNCKKARYCSKKCQKAAWWHHKRDTMENGCNDIPDSCKIVC